MSQSKTGSGPPPPQIVSKPTLPPLADGEDEALAFSGEDLADVQPGEIDLLSTALPDGLASPYAAAQDGWIVGPQTGDPYSNLPGPGGPLSPYAGVNIDPNTNAAADGVGTNNYLGGPTADPYAGAQSLEELWRAMGGNSPDTSQYLADRSEAGTADRPGLTDILWDYLHPQFSVDSSGVSWVSSPNGELLYFTIPFQNGGGYYISPGSLAPDGALVFTEGLDIQSSLPQAATPQTDSQTLPSLPPSPAPSISDDPAGTDLAAGPGQQNSQPGPSAPTTTPGVPGGPSPDDQNWDSAKAGMWDSAVDMLDSVLNKSTGPVGALAPMTPKIIPLDWAKFGPPAATGDIARDADLLDNYRRGAWVTNTISLAGPIGAEGLLDSALSATGRLPSLGVGDAAQELGSLGPELPALAPERPASAGAVESTGLAGGPRATVPIGDLGAISAVTDKGAFRRLLIKIISDERHPLNGLLNAEGKLTQSTARGMNFQTWFEDPTIIEAGHYESAKRLAGTPDRLVVMSAYENRLLSSMVEHPRFGGEMLEGGTVLSIGGIPVDLRTAEALLEKGTISPQVFANAPQVVY